MCYTLADRPNRAAVAPASSQLAPQLAPMPTKATSIEGGPKGGPEHQSQKMPKLQTQCLSV